MPKLNKKIAKNIAAAEVVSSEFELLPDGKYVGELAEVTVEEHQNYPNHMSTWVARFKNLKNYRTGKTYPGSQWLRLQVITDETMPGAYDKGQDKWETWVRMSNGQLKGFFENMGFTADSDTDEMIGELGFLSIGHRTNNSGKRAGQVQNEVRGLEPFPDDFDAEEFEGAVEQSTANENTF